MNKSLIIKILLNKNLDQQIGIAFFNHQKAGVNWREKILSIHPDLKIAVIKDSKKQKKLIENYVEKYYQYNLKKLRKTNKEIEQQWKKIESDFFELVKKYFNNHPWPKGEYKGYLSINKPLVFKFSRFCTGIFCKEPVEIFFANLSSTKTVSIFKA